METAVHDSADLRNAHEMGEEIHATYHREMEATWGPDHITTIPEDYAQHIIHGVRFAKSSIGFLLIPCLSVDVSTSMYGHSLFQTLCLLRLVTHLESRALDLKHEALESLSISVGGTKAAAIWDVIAGAFALHSEPVVRPFSDYSLQTPSEDPFDVVDPAPAISHPLGYDVAAALGYKPVDHIKAALHRLQIRVPRSPLKMPWVCCWFPMTHPILLPVPR